MRTAGEDGIQKTKEDYLEAILMVRERQGYVRSTDLAEQLGVSKPTVTYITRRLKEEGYLTNDHAGMLVLTDSGYEIAFHTYDRHKNLTDFLCLLGVGPEQARIDACKIEHDLSQESYDALCRHVKTCRNPAEQQKAVKNPRTKERSE